MADAVLRERLLVGGAALTGLFLIVLALVGAFVALVGAFVALAWLADRYRQADARIEQILTETLTPAAPDNKPGINLADHDECELLWSVPAHTPRDPDLDAGCDRLLDAIHEHRKENPL
jgi:hypothetical protein